jgi:hypothetical protein
MAAAEPIARAMSNLHRIEATGGQAVQDAAPAALEAARSALSLLQSAPVMHPAVNAALEAVAGSLGVVHRLTQTTGSTRPAAPSAAFGANASLKPNPAQPVAAAPTYAAPVAPAHAVAPTPAYAAATAPAAFAATAVLQPNPAASPAYPAPVAAAASPSQSPRFAPMSSVAQHAVAPGPVAPGPVAPAPVAGNSMADTKQSAGVPRVGQESSFEPNSTMPSQGNAYVAAAAAAAVAQSQAPFGTAPTQPEAGALSPSGAVIVEAALGAHSPTNFYKGLSGNDVVDAGGIFVATYQIPPIGTNIVLRIALPGGYEFQAQAVVRWLQEPSAGVDSTSPGFGAQFTSISQEGRQLVYRYVRNREPLFHDDF